ncbi:MAG: hypothetical protein CALGDGBN_02382 [Pseudomonadales bacterium]|nr:hypothetical protein [Pseudomonadales bacterium]
MRAAQAERVRPGWNRFPIERALAAGSAVAAGQSIGS